MIFLDRDSAFLSSDSEMPAMQVYCAAKTSRSVVDDRLPRGQLSDRSRRQSVRAV